MPRMTKNERSVYEMGESLLDFILHSEFAPAEISRQSGMAKPSLSLVMKNKTWNPTLKTLIGMARARDVLNATQRRFDKQNEKRVTD